MDQTVSAQGQRDLWILTNQNTAGRSNFSCFSLDHVPLMYWVEKEKHLKYITEGPNSSINRASTLMCFSSTLVLFNFLCDFFFFNACEIFQVVSPGDRSPLSTERLLQCKVAICISYNDLLVCQSPDLKGLPLSLTMWFSFHTSFPALS